MAVIHYQFEAIHPFTDGNGRTGRIINILYLLKEGYIDLPIIYLSKYIIENKNRYYELIREVTEQNIRENWILYILQAVKETSFHTSRKIMDIKHVFDKTREEAKEKLPNRVYSKELIELIFKQPYCKVEFLVNEGIAKR
jgi:Fic family protein